MAAGISRSYSKIGVEKDHFCVKVALNTLGKIACSEAVEILHA